MTAVLVVQARDEGLLDLDDPLAAHLGDVGYGDVTVRDALAHSSGMQSEPRGPWWERTRGGDFTALALANDGSGRVAPAGAWFHYSNLGYGLLGEVVARRFGTPWRALVSERLLQPLGMRATSYRRVPAPSRAGASTTSPVSGSTSRSPTPGRWLRPGSCGPPSPTSSRGARCSAVPDPTCWRLPRSRRCSDP